MGTLYDNITGSSGTISYSSGSPSVTYPDAGIYNVLGVTLAPRLYAKDLTALELASSGRISTVLNDVFAFDLSEASNQVLLQTRSNAGWEIANGTRDASFFLNADDTFQLSGLGTCAITTTDDLAITGSNSLVLTGGAASLSLADDLTFTSRQPGLCCQVQPDLHCLQRHVSDHRHIR
jgi:hypothetical protein